MNGTISALNTELDQSDMKGAIVGFPEQIRASYSIMKDWASTHEYLDIQKILNQNQRYRGSQHRSSLNSSHNEISLRP